MVPNWRLLLHQVLDFVPRYRRQVRAINIRWHSSGRFSAHRRQISPGIPASRDGERISAAEKHTYSMWRISFHEWLEHRVQEVPDATTLALMIARSGGVSRDDLRRVARISPETLDELLRALVSAGQVKILKVNGQIVFRAAT